MEQTAVRRFAAWKRVAAAGMGAPTGWTGSRLAGNWSALGAKLPLVIREAHGGYRETCSPCDPNDGRLVPHAIFFHPWADPSPPIPVEWAKSRA